MKYLCIFLLLGLISAFYFTPKVVELSEASMNDEVVCNKKNVSGTECVVCGRLPYAISISCKW